MSIWDDPDLKIGGEFVKFEAPGDSIAGTIAVVRPHRFEDGSVAPQILLTTDDGQERTVTAGQIRLKTALAEQRPETGDHITITLTDVEKRSGGKTLKHFTVNVRRHGAAPSPARPTAPSAPATPPPAPPAAQPAPGVSAEALAALSQLTPEQRAALGL